jgi:hypothetical protein
MASSRDLFDVAIIRPITSSFEYKKRFDHDFGGGPLTVPKVQLPLRLSILRTFACCSRNI